MSLRRFFAVFLLLLGLVPALPARGDTTNASADSATTRFYFAPRDGERWVEELVDVRSTDPGGDNPVQIEETTESDTLLFEKQGEGWKITRIMGPAFSKINGHPFENPILGLSRGTHIVLDCDAQGVAQSVKGFRRLMRKLERKLSPSVWSKYQSSFSLEGARNNEMRRWNLRRAGLIGNEAKNGEVWNFQSLWPAPMGFLEVQGTMRFGGMIDFEGRRACKIFLDYATGTKVPNSKDATRELDLRPAKYTASNSDRSALTGTTVRVLDPTTGHLLYENTKVSWKEPPIRGSQQLVSKQVEMTYRLHPVSEKAQ
jgi:hypothetical protein